MIYVEQTKMDGLGGGNCVAACIASIFELDIDDVAVPCGGSSQAVFNWTTDHSDRGLAAVIVQWDSERPIGDVEPPTPYWWIATVKSPRTAGYHCVVMTGPEFAWDPHPQREQGFGDCLGHMHWIVRDPSKL